MNKESKNKQSVIMVTNPETNERHNCSDIVSKLYAIYQQDPKRTFVEKVELLNSCIEWDDTIDKQFTKLEEIFNEKGLGQEFKGQLDNTILYANRKDKPYIPIAKRYKEWYCSKVNEKGISFLCNELDKLTGGILPGTVCTNAGGTGCMKTTVAMNIAYQAVKDGKNVCYLTLEEPPTQLFSKLLSRVSVDLGKNLTVQDITQHKLDNKQEKILLEEVLPHLSNLKGSFQIIGETDLVNYEFTEIERQLKLVDRNIRNRNNDDHGIDLVVVDHMQLLKYASSTKDEYQVMNNYVSFFRKQALSFLGTEKEISIILLSQVNREGMAYAQKHNGMYLTQHVAEASEIERSSAYILSTFTDGMQQITKLLKVGAIKLRGSQLPLDTINVFADGQFYQAGDTPIPEQDYSSGDIFNDINTDIPVQQDYSLDSMMSGLTDDLFGGID